MASESAEPIERWAVKRYVALVASLLASRDSGPYARLSLRSCVTTTVCSFRVAGFGKPARTIVRSRSS